MTVETHMTLTEFSQEELDLLKKLVDFHYESDDKGDGSYDSKVLESLHKKFQPVTEESLCEIYEEWLEKNDDLEKTSADELILSNDLTSDQRTWLTKYILRWEEVVG